MTADITFDESGKGFGRSGNRSGDRRTDCRRTHRTNPAPLGADATAVKTWFDEIVEAEAPVLDGSLAAEREAAEAYARMAKAENTRRAYRAAVRAWCEWCAKRNLPPLPGSGADVAAFLASERGRGLTRKP